MSCFLARLEKLVRILLYIWNAGTDCSRGIPDAVEGFSARSRKDCQCLFVFRRDHPLDQDFTDHFDNFCKWL